MYISARNCCVRTIARMNVIRLSQSSTPQLTL